MRYFFRILFFSSIRVMRPYMNLEALGDYLTFCTAHRFQRFYLALPARQSDVSHLHCIRSFGFIRKIEIQYNCRFRRKLVILILLSAKLEVKNRSYNSGCKLF